jgi:hypothetical protein
MLSTCRIRESYKKLPVLINCYQSLLTKVREEKVDIKMPLKKTLRLKIQEKKKFVKSQNL